MLQLLLLVDEGRPQRRQALTLLLHDAHAGLWHIFSLFSVGSLAVFVESGRGWRGPLVAANDSAGRERELGDFIFLVVGFGKWQDVWEVARSRSIWRGLVAPLTGLKLEAERVWNSLTQWLTRPGAWRARLLGIERLLLSFRGVLRFLS